MLRFPRPIVRSLALACAVLLGACASLAGLERPPRVTLRGIKPVQIELLEQRYLATIRVQNPNSVELPIDGLEYVISINNSTFADGVSSQRVTVPAFGEKTLQVGVTSTLMKLFKQIKQLAGSGGAITYTITGTLSISGIPGSVPFEHDGEIDLRLHGSPPASQSA
jgi:LEA14-like dessication related protein